MLTVGVQHGAQVRWSLDTNMTKPFFQVPTPEFGLGACTQVQGWDTSNKLGTQASSWVRTDSVSTKAIHCFAYP